MARRVALQEAYRSEVDGFRYRWSGVVSEEMDRDDPFYLCVDHIMHLRSSRPVACATVLNAMKSELSAGEFRRAVH